jgi:hypothetical protein
MRASDEKGAMLAQNVARWRRFSLYRAAHCHFATRSVWPIRKRPLAVATQQAVEFVGLPARALLAHATAYVPGSKSREATTREYATDKIEMEQTKRVPEVLKNKHFR